MAVRRNVVDSNDWANQRVPICSGGGKLELKFSVLKRNQRNQILLKMILIKIKRKPLNTNNNSFYIDVNGDAPYDPTKSLPQVKYSTTAAAVVTTTTTIRKLRAIIKIQGNRE